MVRLRYVLFGAGMLFLAMAVCAWVGYRILIQNLYQPQLKFDAKEWASAPILTKGASSRQLMVGDLIANVLPGSHRTEIARLLSAPPGGEKSGDRQPAVANREIILVLGYEQTLIDRYPERRMEELYLRFDTNGLFSSWYIQGSPVWPRLLGENGRRTYRKQKGRRTRRRIQLRDLPIQWIAKPAMSAAIIGPVPNPLPWSQLGSDRAEGKLPHLRI